MGNALLALAVALAASLQATSSTPQKPMGPPLAMFVGHWQGTARGAAGQGTADRTYEYALGGRFLVSTNRTVYAPREKTPKGETHQDVGYFGYDRQRQRLVLRQFHSEGFVNQYVEQVSDASTSPPAPAGQAPPLVFVSEAIENIPPGWRARESYVFEGNDAFTETFALAQPGKDFSVYSTTRFTRVK